MNSGFRRYTNMGADGPKKDPVPLTQPQPAQQLAEPTRAPAPVSGYDSEQSQFHELRDMILSLSGSGAAIAIFDYGYFGGDEYEYKGSGGGRSAGGGSKLTNDSRQAPSPFSSIFGGGGR